MSPRAIATVFVLHDDEKAERVERFDGRRPSQKVLDELERDAELRLHAGAGGRRCIDDGSGTCAVCGVSLVRCPKCKGRGYHYRTCAEHDA